MRIYICDDAQIYREEVYRLLLAYAGQRDIAVDAVVFGAPGALLNAVKENAPDALFLDIRMDGMDGMELARAIRALGVPCPIVFITSYDGYLQEGYEVRAFRYLLKHQLARDFDAVMDALITEMRSERFIASYNKENIILSVRDILYIESVTRRLSIVCPDGEHTASGTLEAAARELPRFIRCHKGFLVNPAHVGRFSATKLTLQNGAEIPVGRKYAAAALALLADGRIAP